MKTRPDGVSWTASLIALFIVIGLFRALVVPMDMRLPPGYPAGILTAKEIWILVHVATYAVLLFEAICLWAYWVGSFLGRIAVLVESVLLLVSLPVEIIHIHARWQSSPFMLILLFLKELLAVQLLWYLFQPEARAWFRRSQPATSR